MIQVAGNIVDIHTKEVYPGIIFVENGRISEIKRVNSIFSVYIIPGLIDSHVHIESSMLIPSEFSSIAIKHGTVATVSDPHEIANVIGEKGIEFMIKNGENADLKFHWGIPSCVPATEFETSGANLGIAEIKEMFKLNNVVCLAEMMNFPGVVNGVPGVLEKLNIAKSLGLPVDGHAPGLSGDSLSKYIQAGISTDHECSTLDEAIGKIRKGMKILIREGSSAKNFDELAPLIDLFPDKIMLCTDDIHPDDLLKGHINILLKRGIKNGLNLYNLLSAACLNPVAHYKLNAGLLKPGDPADFCVVNSVLDFDVLETWINGRMVFNKMDKHSQHSGEVKPVNNFVSYNLEPHQIRIQNKFKNFKAISVIDGELLTRCLHIENTSKSSFLEPNLENDLLKIIVINRYKTTKPAVGFVKNFGMTSGAIASSVAHDCHNIIAVGTNDADIIEAIHLIMESKGGIAATSNKEKLLLPLPVAGIMSLEQGEKVAIMYEKLDRKAKDFGCKLKAPFMTLSFLALLVIPELKIGDQGLFDVNSFEFTDLFD